jgi:GT2 family glycosyltransferase
LTGIREHFFSRVYSPFAGLQEDLGREALVSGGVSKDGSAPSISGRSLEVFVIGNQENLGFAKVSNQPIVFLEETSWCYRSRKAGWRI